MEPLRQRAAQEAAARLRGGLDRASALRAALLASLGTGSAGRWTSCTRSSCLRCLPAPNCALCAEIPVARDLTCRGWHGSVSADMH